MNLLIAVKSCERDAVSGLNQVIRETWAKSFPSVDVRFFIGNGSQLLAHDEIRVDAPDHYDGLPFKTKGIAKWMVEQDYDFVFLCDTDTFIRPELLNCEFQRYDYAGYYHGPEHVAGTKFVEFYDDRGHVLHNGYWWASGGLGYFLSRRACQEVARATPTHWAEDLSVAQTLGPLGLKFGSLKDYNGFVTWHYPKRSGPVADWLRNAYRHGVPV